MSLATGRLEPRAAHGGDVEMLACSRVTIAARHPVPIQIDGDAAGTTPIEVDAGTCEVCLIVPGTSPRSTNSSRIASD
jgi:diacylglycerol kinase family enzyme